MHLPRSTAALSRLTWCDEVDSTNTVLRDATREQLARGETAQAGSTVATLHQTGGKGRLGRSWVAAPGDTLAFSTLVRFSHAVSEIEQQYQLHGHSVSAPLGIGWLPLMTGVAVSETLRPLLPNRRVGVKWPNDVLVAGHERDQGAPQQSHAASSWRKICGILCEVVGTEGDDFFVVVGCGINLFSTRAQLPVETATSLLVENPHLENLRVDTEKSNDSETLGKAVTKAGTVEIIDRVLSGVATRVHELVEASRQDPSAVRRLVESESVTLGTSVRVHLPNAATVSGEATGFAQDGSLMVRTSSGERLVVSAGDVEHLR